MWFNRGSNKEWLCSLKGLHICYAHMSMHSPVSMFLHAQWCFERLLHHYMLQESAPPCILCCLFTHLHQCIRGASISKLVQSAVFCCAHACGSLMFVVVPFYVQTEFLGSPPTLHFFPLYMCDGYPSSLRLDGSWLSCQDVPFTGTGLSMSWLPIVEASGCLGHSTSI